MSILEIENEIRKLSPEQASELMEWFVKYHGELWDKEIEHDLQSGRFDSVLNEVRSEIDDGMAKPL